MFWGLLLEKGKKYTNRVDRAFHIGSAILDTKTSSASDIVEVNAEIDGTKVLVCNLSPKDGIIQVPLDLNFAEGDNLVFYTSNGSGAVQLTGYIIDDQIPMDDYDDDDEEEEEEEEEEDTLLNSKDGKLKKVENEKTPKQPEKRKKEPGSTPTLAKKAKTDGLGSSVKKIKTDANVKPQTVEKLKLLSELNKDIIDTDTSDEDYDAELEDDDSDIDLPDEEEDELDEEEEEGDEDAEEMDTDDLGDEEEDEELEEEEEEKEKSVAKSALKKRESKGKDMSKKNEGSVSDKNVSMSSIQSGAASPDKKKRKRRRKKSKENGLPEARKEGGDESIADTPKTPAEGKKRKRGPRKMKEGGRTPADKGTPMVNKETPKPEKMAGTPKLVKAGGVVVEDLKVGGGTPAKAGKLVGVFYEGRLKSNNRVFDKARDTPFRFRLGSNEVIKGWDVGLTGMKVGGKRRLTCPPNMAYGKKGAPPSIPPGATLVFDVELKYVN